jgi:hypothetical protein
MIAEKKEVYPLSWPQDWPRTHPRDQKAMGSWKRTANQYREAIGKELERMGAPFCVISSNVPVSARGSMQSGPEPRDVGVAVYFTRQQESDFRWQSALGISDPYPTESQIQESYRRLAQLYHPDRNGDVEMFRQVTQARDAGLAWIQQREGQAFNKVLACDQFREVRLNMAAIAMTLKAIRQIERCGATSLLDRMFKGFAAIAEKASA